MIDARARIIWGESPESVRDFLISHGIAATEVDAHIKAFEAERNAEIRKAGVRNVAVGAAILLAAGIIFYPCYRYLDAVSYTGGVRLIIAFAIGGLYGLWRLAKGLAHLLRPRAEHRPIGDL
jgi:hypothetical protein